MYKLIGLLILFFVSVAAAPPTSKAVKYEEISVVDTSIPNRKRVIVRILAPGAVSLGVRAETALKAAVDFNRWRGFDAVEIFLEINPMLAEQGVWLAHAKYAPDEGRWSGDGPLFEHGSWEVRATDYKPTDHGIRVTVLWLLDEHLFQIDDGFGGTRTDEDALTVHIASLLGISVNEVNAALLFKMFATLRDYGGSLAGPARTGASPD